jgi:hypothetical protein
MVNLELTCKVLQGSGNSEHEHGSLNRAMCGQAAGATRNSVNPNVE